MAEDDVIPRGITLGFSKEVVVTSYEVYNRILLRTSEPGKLGVTPSEFIDFVEMTKDHIGFDDISDPFEAEGRLIRELVEKSGFQVVEPIAYIPPKPPTTTSVDMAGAR